VAKSKHTDPLGKFPRDGNAAKDERLLRFSTLIGPGAHAQDTTGLLLSARKKPDFRVQ
jgi:hypothetical protein